MANSCPPAESIPQQNTDRIGPTCLEQVIPQADAVGFFCKFGNGSAMPD